MKVVVKVVVGSGLKYLLLMKQKIGALTRIHSK